MRALVLGGSAFIGRQLVDTLLHRGHTVTVLNRGVTPHDLPDDVERLVANRLDHSSMVDALAGRDWDAVFDVSGYVMAAGGSDTEALFDLLDGRRSIATQTTFVRDKPMPFPPEPFRFIGIQTTKWSLDREDKTGKRNVWLKSLDKFGLGFDS
jgi:hypothetical protein